MAAAAAHRWRRLAAVAAALPTSLVTRLARQQAQTVDFATSNVRGSPVPMYIAGAQLLHNYPIGPLAGVAFNLTLLSYLGSLDMGLNVDGGGPSRMLPSRRRRTAPEAVASAAQRFQATWPPRPDRRRTVRAGASDGRARRREQRAHVEQHVGDLAGRHELAGHHLTEGLVDHRERVGDHGVVRARARPSSAGRSSSNTVPGAPGARAANGAADVTTRSGNTATSLAAVRSARWTSLIATSSSPVPPEASAPPSPGASPPAGPGSSSPTWAMSAGRRGRTARAPSASGRRCVDRSSGNVELIAPAEEAFGPVDLFFANAGIGGGTDLATSEEDWQLAFDVNVNAHRWAAKHLLAGLAGAAARATSARRHRPPGCCCRSGRRPTRVTKRAAVAFAEWLADHVRRPRAAGQLPVPAGRQHRHAATGDDPALGGGGTEVVRAAGVVLEPEQVADVVADAIAEERFLILPHPEVHDVHAPQGRRPRALAGRDAQAAGSDHRV